MFSKRLQKKRVTPTASVDSVLERWITHHGSSDRQRLQEVRNNPMGRIHQAKEHLGGGRAFQIQPRSRYLNIRVWRSQMSMMYYIK